MDSFFGRYLFNVAVPEDHPFRTVLKMINWESVRAELETDATGQPVEYSTTGRPAYDPLVVFKMFLLQHWYPASDIKVEERAQTDVAYRLFLDVPFPGSVPDATTLCRYRALWGDEKIKQLFKNIFRQIQSHGVAQVRPGMVGDTTHQQACIQKPTARQLLLNGFVKYLQAFLQLGDQFPVYFDQPRIQELGKFTHKWWDGYKERCRSQQISRHERFALLVKEILAVQEEVQKLILGPLPRGVAVSASWQQFHHWKAILEQILAENVVIKDGQPRQKKGKRKIISLVDLDARSGHKSKKLKFTGFKIVVGMTGDRFYTGVDTIPGNENDSPQAIPIVKEAMEVSGEIPEAAAFDLGFDSTGNRLALHELGVQPGIEFKKPVNPRNPGLFTANHFQFDIETLTVTCPANQTTQKFTVNRKTGTCVFRFSKKCCENCSLKTFCTSSKNGRTVQFSEHVQMLEEDREFLQTPLYEQLRKNRWGLEAGFGTGKKANGLGKTPYHGLEKTSLHNRLVGIVLNLKRLLKLASLGFIPAAPPPLPSGHSV